MTSRLRDALADRYRIEREVGQGGMATVYLAHDRKHDRDVALEVLRPELAAALGAERFLAEVKITARLDHPHILTLIDSGEAGGTLFYVMPFVRGESLRARLDRDRQLGLDAAIGITRQIASALDRVTSRSSAMQFAGKRRPAAPEIAKALDVDAIVEGSGTRSGDKVRITAQLIAARADQHRWAQSFERQSSDVLTLQAELASVWLSSSEVLYRSGATWHTVRIDPATGEPEGPASPWGTDPRFSDTFGWSTRPDWHGGIVYLENPEDTHATYFRVVPDWVARMERAVDEANR